MLAAHPLPLLNLRVAYSLMKPAPTRAGSRSRRGRR